jgi:dGTPase
MFDRVYLGATARSEHARVERTMTGLFEHYLANPAIIPALDPTADDVQRVTDYIAGMTDRYCIARFTDLAIPEAARF